MATMENPLEELEQFCKRFNETREEKGEAARLHIVLIMNGTKTDPNEMDFGVSLSKDEFGPLDEPKHLHLTNKVAGGFSGVNNAAKATVKMLKEAVSNRRFGQLPWHTKGESKSSKKRWVGPHNDNPKG